MPCSCWYTPSDETHRLIKTHCQIIVDEIKRCEKIGDPIGISLKQTQELLRHLYYPEECKEKK